MIILLRSQPADVNPSHMYGSAYEQNLQFTSVVPYGSLDLDLKTRDM